MFYDRAEAGEKLAEKLKGYESDRNALILALPRGGVAVGKIIAQKLGLPLDIIVTRKISAPNNPEYAIGAVAEKGEPVLNEEVIGTMDITPDYLDQKITEAREEIKRRLKIYRGNKPKLNIENKMVILVDDGIATGYTTNAAIDYLKNQQPQKIILATPIIPASNIISTKEKVDELIYLEAPQNFGAVGQFYEHFDQVSDEEVGKVLR